MKCKDCGKRIWTFWQKWCSAGLEKDQPMYDYHVKCFKRNHYQEWKWFHPEEVVTVFSGEPVPKSGLYMIQKHNTDCDKLLSSENMQWLTKKSRAPKPIICQHDVQWELMAEI